MKKAAQALGDNKGLLSPIYYLWYLRPDLFPVPSPLSSPELRVSYNNAPAESDADFNPSVRDVFLRAITALYGFGEEFTID
jgi:hypothetical protein